MQEYDWTWEMNSVVLKPKRHIHSPEYGKQLHAYADPYWMFELTLPPQKEATRRDIEALLEFSEGINVFNVYDPRVPIPAHHSSEGAVPALTVKQTDRATSRIMVNGTNGDVITKGDPIAFTKSNKRHYYKAAETVTVSGIDQWLEVFLRPRETIGDVNVVADRIRPTCRFVIDMDNYGGLTNANNVTEFTLRGVEYWGEI
jgi:hypothetical protein